MTSSITPKKTFLSIRSLSLLFSLLLLAFLLSACPNSNTIQRTKMTAITGPKVIIVKSYSSPLYRQVITAFSIESKAAIVEYNLNNRQERAQAIIEKFKNNPPALIFTLGPLATRLIHRGLPKVPLLFALVPQYRHYLNPKAPNTQIMGITLTRSLRYQFLTIKKLSPKVKTIGVIYNPRFSRKLVRQAHKVTAALGLQLAAAKVDTSEDVEDAIRLFEGQVDALWQVADPSIQTSFKPLLRFTFRSKLPFFALSEKFVQAGALVSVSLDYPSIGHQAGQMSNQFLFHGSSTAQQGIQRPKQLQIAFNITTSRRIGLSCSIIRQMMLFAAKNHFRLRIYR